MITPAPSTINLIKVKIENYNNEHSKREQWTLKVISTIAKTILAAAAIAFFVGFPLSLYFWSFQPILIPLGAFMLTGIIQGVVNKILGGRIYQYRAFSSLEEVIKAVNNNDGKTLLRWTEDLQHDIVEYMRSPEQGKFFHFIGKDIALEYVKFLEMNNAQELHSTVGKLTKHPIVAEYLNNRHQ